MTDKNLYNNIAQRIDENKIYQNVSMKEHTSFRVGGQCDIMIMPETEEEIREVISICRASEVPYFVLGKGTNLIVRDEGYHGVIIKLGNGFNQIQVDNNLIIAQAGALMSAISRKAAEHSLCGLEFASGIPGSVGGAIMMNAGAYDGEIGKFVKTVRYLDKNQQIIEIEGSECCFEYRYSKFQDSDNTILKVTLALQKGNLEEIHEKISKFTKARNEKQPLNYPSAGSTFKRPPGNFAGKLIQDAGLMGLSLGGAKVSDLHAGFIINENNATAKDVLDLIEVVKQTVFDRFGVMLESEVKIL